MNAAYLESKRQRRTELRVPVKYRFSRRFHDTVFASDAPLFKTGQSVYGRIEAPRAVRQVAHALEQAAKVPLFGCKDCGDCSLPEIAYVCPESQCAKNQRNGPCGGTRDGLCEVYDTECIWSEAYERLKAYGRRSRCWTARSSSRTTRWPGRAHGRTRSSAATTRRDNQRERSPITG